MVVVERLAFGIFLEERLLQAFEQALLVDVGAGIMDKYARFDVAVRVDMAVVAAAGDAAVDVLAVVLEVDGKNRLAAFGAADFTDAANHVGALLGCRQEVQGSIVADRHVMEIPREPDALLDEEVQEFVGRDRIDILAGIADGRAEEDAVLA